MCHVRFCLSHYILKFKYIHISYIFFNLHFFKGFKMIVLYVLNTSCQNLFSWITWIHQNLHLLIHLYMLVYLLSEVMGNTNVFGELWVMNRSCSQTCASHWSLGDDSSNPEKWGRLILSSWRWAAVTKPPSAQQIGFWLLLLLCWPFSVYPFPSSFIRQKR